MKALLSLIFATLLASAGFAAGTTRLHLNDHFYSDISQVYLGAGDRVIILYPGGGASATVDQLPPEFLQSWGIGQDEQAAAKASAAQAEAQALDHAIQTGAFRKVHNTVYDTRKPQAGWVLFHGVKVLQIAPEGALIDSAPGSYSPLPIFVRHLPNTVGESDYITLLALPDGTFSFLTKTGEEHTVRAYDAGQACARADIPAAVLQGQKAFAAVAATSVPETDVVAKLPESRQIEISGSGFFVSADGYFITNDHVVRNAHRVRLKIGARAVSATVIREDSEHDLALLKTAGEFHPLAVSSRDAELGQEVFTIGFPDIKLQGTEPKYTDGRVSSLAGIQDDPTAYQVSVPVQPGNSGGPLVDTSGNVRGVVVARLDDLAALRSVGSLPQNVNYAIKGSVLREFLRSSPEVKVAPENAASAGAVESVRQAVAIVLVY